MSVRFIWRVVRYFVPRLTARERLPLPTKRYKLNSQLDVRHGDHVASILVGEGVARDYQDAQRLLAQHPGVHYRELIRRYKRRRRLMTRWNKFTTRLKRFIFGAFALALVITPSVSNAQEPPIGEARILAQALNVRAAPDPSAPRLGYLLRGKVVRVYGIEDNGWLRLSCKGVPCYITGSPRYVRLTLFEASVRPVVNAATLPDLVLVSYTIDPATPAPFEPYRVILTVRNAGTADANLFSVAAVFSPSEAFAMATVAGLPMGGQVNVVLSNMQGEPRTGRHTINVALDVEDHVSEGAQGEANNIEQLSMWIDIPYEKAARLRVEAFTNVDVLGIAWDGIALRPLLGTRLAVLDALLSDVHYDLLDGLQGVASVTPERGMIVGVVLPSGQRGAFRVAAIERDAVIVEYVLYSNRG